MALGPVALAGAVAVVALVVGPLSDEGPDELSTFGPDVTAPVSTSAPRPADVRALPGRYTRVVSSATGILVATPEGDVQPRRLTDQPTRLAFGVGGNRVVAQYGDPSPPGSLGDIVVFDEAGTRTLVGRDAADAGGNVQLLDAGFVDERPVAVVTISSSANPESADERLYLVDLETAARTDLGSVGGWEAGAIAARMLPNGDVALLLVSGANFGLELRALDASTTWSVPNLGDPMVSRTMTLYSTTGFDDADATVAVLEPRFVGDSYQPHLVVRQFDLASGAEVTPALEYDLDLEPGLEIPAGFCSYAEGIQRTLLCDQSAGPAIRIGILDGRTVRETGSPDQGTMTFWRFDA
jgi:hypothetical protein